MTPAAGLMAALLLPWGDGGGLFPAWQEIRYAGRTRFEVRAGSAGEPTLRAESQHQNSALLHPLRADPRGLTLRWRWRVLEHPPGADPDVRARDDRAAGVLVIVHRSFFPWRTRALLYQWAPARPRGQWSRSPYSREVRTLVLEDAPADSAWREETRDLAADLERAFGEIPRRIEAVGVICDTDNTRSAAIAEFGALELERDGGAAVLPEPR